MRLKTILLIISFSVLIETVKSETIHQWEVYTISLKSSGKYINPYKDIPVTKDGGFVKRNFSGYRRRCIEQRDKSRRILEWRI